MPTCSEVPFIVKTCMYIYSTTYRIRCVFWTSYKWYHYSCILLKDFIWSKLYLLHLSTQMLECQCIFSLQCSILFAQICHDLFSYFLISGKCLSFGLQIFLLLFIVAMSIHYMFPHECLWISHIEMTWNCWVCAS